MGTGPALMWVPRISHSGNILRIFTDCSRHLGIRVSRTPLRWQLPFCVTVYASQGSLHRSYLPTAWRRWIQDRVDWGRRRVVLVKKIKLIPCEIAVHSSYSRIGNKLFELRRPVAGGGRGRRETESKGCPENKLRSNK